MTEILPLGFSEFTALREAKTVYVDKTRELFDMAQSKRKVLFVRPRRFGKTLLLFTLETLFKDGLGAFKDLWIASRWTDHTYDVVRFDFSGVREFQEIDDFRRKFIGHVYAGFAEYGFEFDPNAKATFFDQLTGWLATRSALSLVVLIDEYDTPLTQCFNDTNRFEGVRALLNAFYETLERHDACLRFMFLTGITRFKEENCSSLKSLTDLTFDPAFNGLIGFTTDEIQHDFPEHVREASQFHGVPERTIVENLAHLYGGYAFDQTACKTVLCPWSVLNVLNDSEFEFSNYWYQSGEHPTHWVKRLLNRGNVLSVCLNQGAVIPVPALLTSRSLDEIAIKALLQQAGYLSIKYVDSDDMATLGVPNQEVAVSLAQLIFDLCEQMVTVTPFESPTNRELMLAGDLGRFIENVNQLLLQLDPRHFEINDDASACAFFKFVVLQSALSPEIIVHEGFPTDNLVVDIQNTRWVIVFTYAEDPFGQLKNPVFDESDQQCSVRQLALVFDGAKRQYSFRKDI